MPKKKRVKLKINSVIKFKQLLSKQRGASSLFVCTPLNNETILRNNYKRPK